MHIMRVRVFPRGDTLIYFPLLARVGPLAGADKATLSIRGSASLAPAFLAVMIFTVISDRYPRPDITVFYISTCGRLLRRTRHFISGSAVPRGPDGCAWKGGYVRHLSPPCNLNPATVFAVKCTRSAPTSRGRW